MAENGSFFDCVGKYLDLKGEEKVIWVLSSGDLLEASWAKSLYLGQVLERGGSVDSFCMVDSTAVRIVL